MKRREFLKMGAIGGIISVVNPFDIANKIQAYETGESSAASVEENRGVLREVCIYDLKWNREEVRLEVATKDKWYNITFVKYEKDSEELYQEHRKIALKTLISTLKKNRIRAKQLRQLSAPKILNDHCTFYDLTY